MVKIPMPNAGYSQTLCSTSRQCRLFVGWFVLFYSNCIFPLEFLSWETRVVFAGESQLRQSRATQSTVHAGCFNISTIYRTLMWTAGSSACTHMLMHAIAHGGVRVEISAMRNSGCLPRGKPTATESRHRASGACWVFSCFHNPPNSVMDYRIFNVRTDVNACDRTE